MSAHRIGFMQGRLSPLIDEKIQAFPWPCWRDEFQIAERCGLRLMEWTLDQDRLYENPLMTAAGQQEIRHLCGRYGINIPSLTGDCFMQAPFYKAEDERRQMLLKKNFIAVVEACAAVGISMIVVPLVDNGRLENEVQEDGLVGFLEDSADFFRKRTLSVIFESDFSPERYRRFIDRLEPGLFGINYDIGNSAALGYRPDEEIDAYGERIVNVHVKDRKLGGTTVPLGDGNADFDRVFSLLARIGYQGNFILQTARAMDNDHAAILCRYRDMTEDWLRRSSHHAT